jgi:hypothetical protein
MLLVVCGNPMQQQQGGGQVWIWRLERENLILGAILTKINPIDYFTRYQVLELPAIFARITSIAAKVLYRSLLYLRPPADQFCGIHSFDGD